ncbi:MAG: hypothetical protein Devi2KO_04190 [Devosia indica]
MASLAQLQSYRATAGARYLAAIVELRAAYVELSGLEGALINANVGGLSDGALQRFRGDADGIPEQLQHPIYAPGHRAGMAAEARAAAEQHIAEFPTPDEE